MLAISVYLLLLSWAVSSVEAAEMRHCSSPESKAGRFSLAAQAAIAPAGSGTPEGATQSGDSGLETVKALFIVAHPDDDLLFMNPDIATCIKSGDEVRTVYLTVGDAGRGLAFGRNRERGIFAAYARMAGVVNAWTATDRPIGDKLIRIYRLDAAPKVSTVFLRLPDGDRKGRGYAATGFQSMTRLWENRIIAISSLDGKNTYTKTELIQTLAYLMMDFRTHHVHTQDASNLYGKGHSGHQYGARFALEAHHIYAASGAQHTFTTYRGYNIAAEPRNLPQDIYEEKRAVFLTYAEHCRTPGEDCLVGNFDGWGHRQYAIAQAQNLSGQIRLFSGECLTAGADTLKGIAPVLVSVCLHGHSRVGDGSHQTWSIHSDGSITSFGGRCLEVRGGSSGDGTPIQLAPCTGTSQQRWTAFENGQIRGLAGKCLDFGGGRPTASTSVQLYHCAAVPRQRWLLPLSSTRLPSSPDFSLAPATGSSFIPAGQSATYELVLTPHGLSGAVALSCSGAPQNTTCIFSPQTATLDGQNPVIVGLTASTALRQPRRIQLLSTGAPLALFLMLLLGLLILFTCKKRTAFSLLGITLVLFVLAVWGKRSETTSGATTITVTANSGNLSRKLPVILRVK